MHNSGKLIPPSGFPSEPNVEKGRAWNNSPENAQPDVRESANMEKPEETLKPVKFWLRLWNRRKRDSRMRSHTV